MPVDVETAKKFIGEWRVQVSETMGADEMGRAMGFPPIMIDMFKRLEYSLSFTLEGQVVRVAFKFNNQLAPSGSITVGSGEKLDYPSPDGGIVKVIMNIEDGIVTDVHEDSEKGLSWTTARSVDGDVMTAVTTCRNETMRQTFKRE
ncbi:unnamed protein product [Lymnaea stagnalis]|uniref:Uncharacterized protein n=1 Tax=Lymnaea stagnalis TaxID=6523 RepID=A0AAV2HQG6_LYMST